jgi:hypothetical protein
MAEARPISLQLLRSPLWRPVWGLWIDRRFLRSPALVLVTLVLALALLDALGRLWMAALWVQEAPAGPMQLRLYDLLMIWRRCGLELILLLFALTLLWHIVARGMAPSLRLTRIGPTDLIMVVLFPIAVIWGIVELGGWIQSINLAQRLAEPGDRLIWIIRRPGQITSLTDVGPPPAVVLIHNALTGTIAIFGYLAFLLWWGWVIVRIAAAGWTLNRSLGALTVIAGATLALISLVRRVQSVVPLFHPFALWMFPPGTATFAERREELLSPIQHFHLYASMHLAILFVELGLVGLLLRALGSAQRRLWETVRGPEDTLSRGQLRAADEGDP